MSRVEAVRWLVSLIEEVGPEFDLGRTLKEREMERLRLFTMGELGTDAENLVTVVKRAMFGMESVCSLEWAVNRLISVAGPYNRATILEWFEACRCSRTAFVLAVDRLRRMGSVSLSVTEHAVSLEVRAAGIRDHDELLVYASIRE